MNIVLVGYRGTGKTTVARHVAGLLSWEWVDADIELERLAGKSIAEFFQVEGEQAFRDLESAVLEDLAKRDRTVIAAGGGAVLRSANRDRLRGLGRVVCLTAAPAVIASRLAADPSTALRRPNLTAKGGQLEIEQLLEERRPLYESCAEFEVDTGSRTPAEVAAFIIAQLDIVSLAEPT